MPSSADQAETGEGESMGCSGWQDGTIGNDMCHSWASSGSLRLLGQDVGSKRSVSGHE